MAKLYSREMSKKDLLRRVGDLEQIAGVRSYVRTEGKAEGVRAVEVRTGGGLSYTVLPSRALDISTCEFQGIPIGFLSKSGVTAPAYFSPDREPWGGSFGGGMVTTCGLTNVGVCPDYKGEKMGTHGDIANIPASHVGTFEEWEGDELKMGVCGKVRQARIYREELELSREIVSYLGENKILIRDTVENLGAERQPLMLLYHINFGFPMVSGDTVFEANVKETIPADADPTDVETYVRYWEPGENGNHHCVHHDLIPDGEGYVSASLVNRALGVKVTVRYKKEQLKNLTHWKLLAEGDYVTAIEPCNCFGKGTAGEEQNGTLEYIEPYEKREFEVELSFERI